MAKLKIDKTTKNYLKKYVDMEVDEEKEFPLPKYTTQIFNLISSNAQATRPSYVGQMSEIVPKFINEFYDRHHKFPNWEDWKKYYLDNYKDKYDEGYERLREYVKIHKEAFDAIYNDEEEELMKNWYDKFLLIQNFKGFQFEQFILTYLQRKSRFKDKPYVVRKSTPEEESRNIDIVIENGSDELWLNVKPMNTYDITKGPRHYVNDENILILLYSLKGEDIEIEFANEQEEQKFNEF